MKKTKFYICPHCRNTVQMIYDTDIPLFCCGDRMNELLPNTQEASTEKHLPAVNVTGNTVEVSVGSVHHPMQSVHWIEWVQLETDKGSDEGPGARRPGRRDYRASQAAYASKVEGRARQSATRSAASREPPGASTRSR